MPDHKLTELQLEIMRILWEREEATVVEVREAVRPRRDLAHTTVATLLSRLEKKGVVKRRLEGRQFLYSAAVEAQRMRRSLVANFGGVAERIFGGNIADVVTHLLAERDVNADELAQVRKMIEAKEAELRRRKKK